MRPSPHPPGVEPSVSPDATPFVGLIPGPDREFSYHGTHQLRVLAVEQYEGGSPFSGCSARPLPNRRIPARRAPVCLDHQARQGR